MSYTNMINAAENTISHKNVKNIVYITIPNFKLECKREGLEKRAMHKIFILVQSNLSYIKFVKATQAWLCTISKDLQSLHPCTFKICKNTQKRLLNHIRIKPTQEDTSCRLGKPPSTSAKVKKDQTSMVAQTCLPQPPSPSFKHQEKCYKN